MQMSVAPSVRTACYEEQYGRRLALFLRRTFRVKNSDRQNVPAATRAGTLGKLHIERATSRRFRVTCCWLRAAEVNAAAQHALPFVKNFSGADRTLADFGAGYGTFADDCR